MSGKQLGFSDYELTTAKKQTKREKFLSEMEAVVPWQSLIELIEPHYPKASKKGGRPPYPLATMLRIHLLQQWYSLSDPAMEEALIEVPTKSPQPAAGIGRARVPSLKPARAQLRGQTSRTCCPRGCGGGVRQGGWLDQVCAKNCARGMP